MMKVVSFRFLALIILSVWFGVNTSNCQPLPCNPLKDNNVHRWIEKNFAKGKIPPFSFVIGGISSNDFIMSWQYSAEKLKLSDPDKEEYVYSYTDNQSGLVVRCAVTCFNDFQAIEWVLKFSNVSDKNTPVIEKALVIDHSFVSGDKGTFILRHMKGSKGGKDDFMPLEDTLEIGKTVRLTPAGGRSSDNTASPFFNIKNPTSDGLIVAIGWSGKWYADLCQTGENILSLRTGMEKMKLILYPKEEIRTPGICILFWKGEEPMAGHNQFRRFILTHKTRNNSIPPPLAISLSPNSPSPCNGFFGCLTDTFAIAKIDQLKQSGIVPEVCWMDAGWYQGGGDNWQIIGDWKAEKKRFPNGLKPVADATHSIGAKFLLWFEPERVAEGTKLATEHESWLIRLPGYKKNSYTGKQEFVYNLGLKEARLWLTDYISDFIKKEGIDYFRQDFNLDPMPFWEVNDKPDRIGMSEIRHIEGLYAFWDSLLVRFPHLIIDNCASGGRRIDLETISRSSPLWRSDYLMDEPEGLQNHTYGLNYYIPVHGTGNLSFSPYDFRSGMSSTMVLFWDIINQPRQLIPQMQQSVSDFKRLRPYYFGDYYPLTGTKTLLHDNGWLAYQLNRPEKGDGIIMAFRRKSCFTRSVEIKLRGISKKANYELFNEDSHTKVTKSGEELMRGLILSVDEKPGSLLIGYKKLK